MNELDAAIWTALTGASPVTDLLANGTASVHSQLAPQSDDPPYVVFSRQSRTPSHVLAGVAYENLLYQVQGVTIGESVQLAGSIEAAVDGALVDQALSVSGHSLMYLRRESGIDFTELTEGQRHNHRGAIYRAMLKPD